MKTHTAESDEGNSCDCESESSVWGNSGGGGGGGGGSGGGGGGGTSTDSFGNGGTKCPLTDRFSTIFSTTTIK